MSKNYMPEIARMLGVEIGEEFDILNENGEIVDYNPYKFTGDSIIDCEGDVLQCWRLWDLLIGEHTIQKRPWRPKVGELFWTINGKGDAEQYHFTNDVRDLALLNIGNCFPTREATEAAKPEMLAKFEEIKKGVRE